MLKRKDWQLFQGQDGSGSESSDDGDSVSEGGPELSSSSLEGQDQDIAAGSTYTSDIDDGLDIRRLEDLSEDDFDSDKDGTDLEAAALKERWLAASKEDAANLPKAALACRLCKGVLMLGPASLRQHLESKRHIARQKHKAEDFEPVILAIGSQAAPELETHQERMQRTKDLLSSKGDSKQKLKKRKRGLKTLGNLTDNKSKGSKPGKRQRAELKAQKNVKLDKSKLAGKEKPPVTSILPHEAALPKSAFWSSPNSKVSDGKKKSLKLQKKVKSRQDVRTGKPSPASSIANRAERRRVKNERLKAITSSK